MKKGEVNEKSEANRGDLKLESNEARQKPENEVDQEADRRLCNLNGKVEVIKKGPGRPSGSKDRKKRRRRTKKELERQRKNAKAFASMIGQNGLEDGEKVEEALVYLSVKQALNSEHKIEWEQAISKEEARLKAIRGLGAGFG